jgi:peptide/nickel transport system permease protein
VSALPEAADVITAPPTRLERSDGVWKQAAKRLRSDATGMVSLVIVLIFILISILTATGLLASDWSAEVAVPYAPPGFIGPDTSQALKIEEPTGPMLDLSAVDPLAPKYAQIDKRAAELATQAKPRLETLPFGADRSGRNVLLKALKGSEVSIFVGLAAALVATAIGTILGALAGFFGGVIGDVLEWFYNVFTSVPGILLIFAFAAVLGRGIGTVVVILGLTGWTSVYRLLRAEYIKHSNREYVLAAQAIGTSRFSRMFIHILPNVSHVILVQVSLNVVFFIKAEVILSFLGLGVPVDSVSWGTMLNEAQAELILGKWWQLVAATVLMAIFVTAFSILTDSLRDALDPKLR